MIGGFGVYDASSVWAGGGAGGEDDGFEQPANAKNNGEQKMKPVIGQIGKLALVLTLASMLNNAPAQINLLTGTTVTQPQLDTGNVIVWSPAHGAFRAGNFSNWGLCLADYSFALGYNPLAGNYAIAIGEWSMAGAQYSVAHGRYAAAYGEYAIAMGDYAYTDGQYSMAIGNLSYAGTNKTIAIGYGATAYYDSSIAIGDGSYSERRAVAIGIGANARGDNSLAIGHGASAWGRSAISIGNNSAQSYGSTVVGHNNVDTDSDWDWQPAGELFVVGNGTSNTARSNALVMKKNANMRAGGTGEFKQGLRTPPMGDISMGDFTAGRNPETLNNGLMYSDE